ncbi:MAG: glycosyltransferase family 39 protein [Candidatus Zixiibacteriota bacterium]|nr:MAG: glycosyltransferase family 39 protein [candidate division Zixibacteria bacterium]
MESDSSKIDGFIRKHAFLIVILVAIILRLLAVFFSKGFMASDDQYETVDVAYNWLRNGLWSPEGLLTWGGTVTREVSRFPLYTLFLYGIMKIYLAVGVDSLNTIMYGVRAVHAAISLVSVWAVFRVVEDTTRSRGWAAIAGLVTAAHFAMPFLSVRTLIEMVGGHLWVVAILLFYRYRDKPADLTLVLSGLIVGLAWVIRFQVALAAVAVPFVLWWEYRKLRPAVLFSAGVAAVVLISGVVDYFLLGSFADSTINYLRQSISEATPYKSSPLIYPAVLLFFFIPPLSLAAFSLAAVPSYWKKHRMLIWTTLVFVVAHTLASNRQERFMITIIPTLIILLTLAVHHHWSNRGLLFRKRRLIKTVVYISAAINLLLLFPMTLNYAHRGKVEPLTRIEAEPVALRVIFIAPETGGIFPLYYGGYESPEYGHLLSWSDLSRFSELHSHRPYTHFIIYPPSAGDMPRYADTLTAYFGQLTESFHVGPSTVDYVLHLLNPEHNPTGEAWIYKPAELARD